jgi:hypothetical protein
VSFDLSEVLSFLRESFVLSEGHLLLNIFIDLQNKWTRSYNEKTN